MAFVNLKWKKRDTTDFIFVVKRDLKGIDIATLRNKCIRRGELDLGYHFVIRANGNIEAARPSFAYAGWWFDKAERGLAVLVDTAGEEKISMAAKKALKILASKYPGAIIKEVAVTEEMEV